MFQAISTLDLANVSGGAGGSCNCGQLSHADHLANGNGGIVPKLPGPKSHADHLRDGNGGIVPKLPKL